MTRGALLPPESRVPALAHAIAERGGRLVVVGGWVRDQWRGVASKDLDAEIFGLSPERIDTLLDEFGSVGRVGQHFPVWRLRHQNLDIGFPRAGSDDYHADAPDSLQIAFRKAARHRDLTINAMGWDPIDGTWLDPFGGRADLEANRLCAVDPDTFGSDPVRGLRVARLRALLGAEVDRATIDLCRALDLSSTPVERKARELQRILTETPRPSLALDLLAETNLLSEFPVLDDLRGVPQDVRWHPEGDVFIHTAMVVDAARELAGGLEREAQEILGWAALCHDLGKPGTTARDGDRVRSIGHESLGAELTRSWLQELRVPHRIVGAVEALVAHHLAPSQFVAQGAGPRAYRRLARKLEAAGVTMIDLERVARADHLGRTTADARAGRFDAGDAFLEAAQRAGVSEGVRRDIVTAEALMHAGFVPGPLLGRAIERARELQDEDATRTADDILARVREDFAGELG